MGTDTSCCSRVSTTACIGEPLLLLGIAAGKSRANSHDCWCGSSMTVYSTVGPETFASGAVAAGMKTLSVGSALFLVATLVLAEPIPAPSDVAEAPADASTTASGLASKVMAPGKGKANPARTEVGKGHDKGGGTGGEDRQGEGRQQAEQLQQWRAGTNVGPRHRGRG